ncbi:hypothetical protein [Bacillus wiedmannii]|uniref:Uncharacterized protein n=1 Tax=Bacillus wiedmannii TaxID=1890302 RepID=A0A2A7W6N5_9BACI|nr:hypothetical protein [Bacillus wiedmannii]PEJ11509.1 hypothetical protein CN684_00680 [Bacillus wiedmannii]PHC62829.1 hypothetical protein COF35_27930 [Bacillus wiedmannii]
MAPLTIVYHFGTSSSAYLVIEEKRMELKADDVFCMERRFPIDDHYETCMLEGMMLNDELFLTADEYHIGVYDFQTFLDTKDLSDNFLEIHVYSKRPLSIKDISQFKNKSIIDLILYYVNKK